LTARGIDLVDVYVGPSGALPGAARLSQEAQERDLELAMQHEIEMKKINLENKRKAMEAQVAALRAQFEAEEEAAKRLAAQEDLRRKGATQLQKNLARLRKAD
jgi:circadian clock protein KaiC